MDATEQHDLLTLLKTLADEQRLTMVGLMNKQERTVSEMASLLELSEPTVSHHVSKMHSAGLLNLRTAGNQRFYRINDSRLNVFKAYIANIDSLPPTPQVEDGNKWIDDLNWAADEKKVLRDYTLNGRLLQFPTKEKRWLVVLRWLSTFFESGRQYTEKEINAILTPIHADYATMRRNLVEYGFMRRERGGGNYWLTEEES